MRLMCEWSKLRQNVVSSQAHLVLQPSGYELGVESPNIFDVVEPTPSS
jgi:hypothetical protein